MLYDIHWFDRRTNCSGNDSVPIILLWSSRVGGHLPHFQRGRGLRNDRLERITWRVQHDGEAQHKPRQKETEPRVKEEELIPSQAGTKIKKSPQEKLKRNPTAVVWWMATERQSAPHFRLLFKKIKKKKNKKKHPSSAWETETDHYSIRWNQFSQFNQLPVDWISWHCNAPLDVEQFKNDSSDLKRTEAI